jgi:hypothetical protein
LNSKINSITGKQQANVFLQGQELKQKAELVSWQLKSKEPGRPDQRRRKTYVKNDERIKKKLWKNTTYQMICTNA